MSVWNTEGTKGRYLYAVNSDWHTCTLSIRDTNSVFIEEIETERGRKINTYIFIFQFSK